MAYHTLWTIVVLIIGRILSHWLSLKRHTFHHEKYAFWGCLLVIFVLKIDTEAYQGIRKRHTFHLPRKGRVGALCVAEAVSLIKVGTVFWPCRLLSLIKRMTVIPRLFGWCSHGTRTRQCHSTLAIDGKTDNSCLAPNGSLQWRKKHKLCKTSTLPRRWMPSNHQSSHCMQMN